MKKHVLCFGDSNTHGYCADPSDSVEGGMRFNEDERWTCLLQKSLGDDYLVIEEGLNGRTTVFQDPLYESMDALTVAYPILKSHEIIDLLIIMLGTNDMKERFCVGAPGIAAGMDRLIKRCISVDCWGEHKPNILIICPPHIGKGFYNIVMGDGCVEKSEQLAAFLLPVAKQNECHFLDAEGCEINSVDFTHLSRRGHTQLASMLSSIVPLLL